MTRNRDLARGFSGADSNGVLGAENLPDLTLTTDVYDSVGLLPVSQAGTIAYASSTTNPYVSVGSGWARMSSSNSVPIIDSISFPDGTVFTHPTIGSANTLRAIVHATDPDSAPIAAYDYSLGSNSSDLFTFTSQSGNTFSFTRSTTVSAASRTFTLSADDGVADPVSSATQTFTLGEGEYQISVGSVYAETSPYLSSYATQVRIRQNDPNDTSGWISDLQSNFPSSLTFRSIILKNYAGTTIASVQLTQASTFQSSGNFRYTFDNGAPNIHVDFLQLGIASSANPTVYVLNGTNNNQTFTSNNLIADQFSGNGIKTINFHNSTVASATTGNRTFTYTFTE